LIDVAPCQFLDEPTMKVADLVPFGEEFNRVSGDGIRKDFSFNIEVLEINQGGLVNGGHQ
jgi:hypothetical protein